jgi:hypothetical protein
MSERGKELFEFLDMVQLDQRMATFDGLNVAMRKAYADSRYMMHRFLSMNIHYLPIVNEIQKYRKLPDRSHYQFLTEVLPKGKTYAKYIKGSRTKFYDDWLVALVAKHYNVSRSEAVQYLDIYYDRDKDGLRVLCEQYGTDPKLLKKAEL